jgi:hypothetical protein
MHSEQINELLAALSQAQGKIGDATKGRKAYNYNYADLASCWSACRGALSEHGLSIIQTVGRGDAGIVLRTMLGHSSGQWIDSEIPITLAPNGKKNELQELGSALTYLRRYSLMAMVGISPVEDDDDGAAAASYQAPREQGREAKPEIARLSAQQVKKISEMTDEDHISDLVEFYQKKCGARSLQEVPATEYTRILDVIAKRKMAPALAAAQEVSV